MTKQTKLLLASLLFASTLSANDTMTNISFEQDSDGNLNPNIVVPLFWSEDMSWYSALGYTSSTTKEIGKLDAFSDSKNGAVSNNTDTKLNWATKVIGNYSVGLQTNFIKKDTNEFGYIHDMTDAFGNGTDYWIAFDNEVELDITKTSLLLEYGKQYGDLLIKTSANLALSTDLKVKQSTFMKPLVSTTGTSNSNTSQDFGYAVKLEGYYDTHSLIKLGFEYGYDYSPTKYEVAQLDKVSNVWTFAKNKVDTDVTTTKYLGKIYIARKMFGDLIPSIGFGSINTKTKDNLGGGTISNNNSIFAIGVEKRF